MKINLKKPKIFLIWPLKKCLWTILDITVFVPFVDGYYRIDEIEKPKNYLKKLLKNTADRLNYFKSLDANLQYTMGEEIITEIERYRTLVEADLKHGKISN